MYDEAQVARILRAVSEAAGNESVSSITEHFAGYFDELGLTITVKPETTNEEIFEIKERIVPLLVGRDYPFKWLVTFSRSGKTAGVLFPDGMFG